MDTDKMMERMGFSPQDRGPYVTALREQVARQISDGMVNRSSGTWAEDAYDRDERGFITGYKISAEDRARAFLDMEWAIQRGYSYEVKCIDSPIWRTFDAKTMRSGIKIHWEMLLPWVGDRMREIVMHLRIWRDKLAGIRNPYRQR